jgi:hypothetical protein
MRAPVEAYPLPWPPHRKRTPEHQRRRAPFHRKVQKQYTSYGNSPPSYYMAKEGLSLSESRDDQ